MQRKSKLFLFFSIIFILNLNFIARNPLFKDSLQNFEKNKLETSQLHSGNYTGDISIMYFDQNSISTSEFNTQSTTQMIPHNISRPGVEYIANSLDIYAEVSYGHRIAGNVSEQISLSPSIAFAQEFICPDIEKLEAIIIYLNYSLSYEPVDYYYWDMYIVNETLSNDFYWNYIDYFWNYEERKVVDEWMAFYPNIDHLEPGKKYNIILTLWHPIVIDFPYNAWKAENYTDAKYDKGLTRFFDGLSWTPIVEDNKKDMLCYLLYRTKLDPALIDIDFVINNEYIDPIYSGTYVFWSHSFDAPLNQNINLTILSDQVLPVIKLYVDIYYIYLREAEAIYQVDDSQILWSVNYSFREIHYGWPPPMFLFEKDWDLVSFYDPYLRELTNIYFGPVSLYNESFYGITTIFGIPLTEGTYIGVFQSPNYCNTIDPKLKTEGNFVTQGSFELGQTIRIEAEIISSIYGPMSDGYGSIKFKSPSGSTLFNETGLTPLDGILMSSEIILNDELSEGLYEVEIFWTNGKEIAYRTIQLEIRKPLNLFLISLLSVVGALIAVSIALVARRQIRMRNWEKSLKNLFVLTKDGISLFEYSFGIEIQDPALISGMIAALTQFVREATGSKKSLRTVDQEDKKVLLYHGNYTTIALLTEKDLPIIHKRIKEFSEEFENTFNKEIRKFSGEVSAFKHANVIVNKYFPLNVEEQVIRGVREKLIEFRERLNVLTDPRHIISPKQLFAGTNVNSPLTNDQT